MLIDFNSPVYGADSETVYKVSTLSELYTALSEAIGGETISLTGGVYGEFKPKTTWHGLNYDSPVMIVSADPDNPAIFTEMNLNGASNITFDGIAFNSFLARSPLWYEPFVVRNSSDITIKNSLFEGAPAEGISELEDGTGRAKGLFVENGVNIDIIDNDFIMWHRGMVISDVTDLEITGNDIHSIRSDGINLAGVHNTLIEGNYLHDFKTVLESADHADMIQVINLGNSSSTNLMIRGNIFDVGEGNHTQTLFMRNQAADYQGYGEENYYQNVDIIENVILNGHAHGITVGHTNGLVVSNNTVLSVEPGHEEFSSVPYITVESASKNVTIDNNVTQWVSGHEGQSDWTVGDNVFAQNTDPTARNYYLDEFITSTLQGGDIQSLTARLGGAIDAADAGAQRLLHGDSDADSIDPLFDIFSVADTPRTFVFDASATLGHGPETLGEGAKFSWDFGDGAIGAGVKAQHAYSDAGVYTGTLTVTTADGRTFTEASPVKIAGHTIVSLDEATGAFLGHAFGESYEIVHSKAVAFAQPDGSHAILIGRSSGVSVIPKGGLMRYFGSDNFDLSMNIKARDPGESFGEIARIHDSFLLTATADGDVRFTLWLDTGAVNIQSEGVQINDGAEHSISIQLDDVAGELQIHVDGVIVAAKPVKGEIPGIGSHDLTFGNAWGKQTFEGQVSDFSIYTRNYDYTFTEPLPDAEETPPETSPPSGDNDDGGVAVDKLKNTPETSHEQISPPDSVEEGIADDQDGIPVELVEKVLTPNEKDGTERIKIGDDGELSSVQKEDLAGFFGSENFRISMTLTADEPGESFGEIARIHDSFILQTDADGNLNLVLFLDSGAVRATTTGVTLNDGGDHDISIIFDNEANLLKIDVDGQEAASVSAEGKMTEMAYWDLTFGNPWGTKRNFDGEISDFQIDIAIVAEATEIREEKKSNNGIIYGAIGSDTLTGYKGADRIIGEEGADFIYGRAGGDYLSGGLGDDYLAGGVGRDEVDGNGGQDKLNGGVGRDTLDGGDGKDVLHGQSGRDHLIGNRGADDLYGGRGRDVIEGGEGRDDLWGKAGRDLFVLNRGDGRDKVHDYQDGSDKFVIESGAESFDDLQINQTSDNTTIAFANVRVVVLDEDASNFGADDFIFA